jgi:hypothetical protein
VAAERKRLARGAEDRLEIPGLVEGHTSLEVHRTVLVGILGNLDHLDHLDRQDHQETLLDQTLDFA